MNFEDETLNIETPENVAFGYSVAGIGSRFLAALLDTFLIFFIQILVILPTMYFINPTGTFAGLGSWLIAMLSLLAFALFWGYYIIFEMLWNGQSPGKSLVGLRVVRRDGTPITLVEVLIRNLLRAIDLLPTAYGVGVVVMFIDARSRRLGDLAAGTLVVHDRAPIALESLAVQRPAPLAASELTEKFEGVLSLLERLDKTHIQLVEDYEQRRATLVNRDQLAAQLLNRICARAGLDPSPYASTADYTLCQLARAARAARQ